MSQSKSRLDIPWPNDTECMGLCPVPFVVRIPTILWCRVPSLPCWWLGVHIRPMYCTPLPATQEWKWTGLKWISKWEVRPPLPWFLTFRLSRGTSQTLYWANPLERWWRNASLWGVKVGVQNVAWWAVCHRRRLPLWGGVAVGAWMTLGAGHGLCILSEFGFLSQAFGTLVLVCRLLNATNKHTNMSMSGQNPKSPSCLPSTPNNTESPDADPATPRPPNPMSCPEDRRLVATTVVKHWPLTICCWSVHCYRNVVMNTTQSTRWMLSLRQFLRLA